MWSRTYLILGYKVCEFVNLLKGNHVQIDIFGSNAINQWELQIDQNDLFIAIKCNCQLFLVKYTL